MDLKDLKVIVTGAANGMGTHFANQLAAAGASVAAGDIDVAGLERLAPGIHTRRLDVTDDADLTAFVDWAAAQMGGLNGLINNAGIIRDGLLVRRDRKSGEITKLSRQFWDDVLAVNLTGATMMVRETIAKMIEIEQFPGVIVTLSSISRHGNAGQSNYVAAKAALAANTLTWAREFSRYGIRFGAIAPGMVATPMPAGMNEKALAALTARIPVGRIGLPEDIWQAIRFVLECDYFNGRTIDVDGGLSM